MYHSAACFSAESTILTYDPSTSLIAPRAMKNLKTGDSVMSFDEHNGELIFDYIIGFLHNSDSELTDYFKIFFNSNIYN